MRYEYRSNCCGHYYIEQRVHIQPMVHNQCNMCGNGTYDLIQETILEEVELPAGIPVIDEATE